MERRARAALRRHQALGPTQLVLVLAHARLASSTGVLVQNPSGDSLIHSLGRFRDQRLQTTNVIIRARGRRHELALHDENLLHARGNLRLARLVVRTLRARQTHASFLVLRRSHDERPSRRRGGTDCARKTPPSGLGSVSYPTPSAIRPNRSPRRATDARAPTHDPTRTYDYFSLHHRHRTRPRRARDAHAVHPSDPSRRRLRARPPVTSLSTSTSRVASSRRRRADDDGRDIKKKEIRTLTRQRRRARGVGKRESLRRSEHRRRVTTRARRARGEVRVRLSEFLVWSSWSFCDVLWVLGNL